MTEDRVKHLLEVFGADVRRWPADERNAARALLAAKPSLSAFADEARSLDRLLEDWTVTAPGTAQIARLTGAILARAKATPQEAAPPETAATPVYRGETGFLSWLRPLWPNMVGLAASAALGLFIGWYEIDASADELSDDVVDEMMIEEELAW